MRSDVGFLTLPKAKLCLWGKLRYLKYKFTFKSSPPVWAKHNLKTIESKSESKGKTENALFFCCEHKARVFTKTKLNNKLKREELFSQR